jgi:hypothetical protein
MIEIAADVAKRRDRLRGFEMVERPPHLPHFTARFSADEDWVRAVYGGVR